MRLTISKSLFLATITMGLVIGANGAAEAYSHKSALSGDASASDNLQYLAQFSGSRNCPDMDSSDMRDRLGDMRDRLGDMRDRRGDIDMDDLRENMEDRRGKMGLGFLVALGVARAVKRVRSRFIKASSSPEVEVFFPEMRTVKALGRLASEGDLIQLSVAPSNERDRVAQLLVTDGETVETGQGIAILASRDRLQADLAEAQEQLGIAQIQLDQALAKAKQSEIDALRAEIARLEKKRVPSPLGFHRT